MKNTCKKIIALFLTVLTVFSFLSVLSFVSVAQIEPTAEDWLNYMIQLDSLPDYSILETQSDDRDEEEKMFPTARLQVIGEDIPDLGQTASAVSPDGMTVLQFKTPNEAKDAYNILSASPEIESVCGENIYTVSVAGHVESLDFPFEDNLSWGADYVDSPYAVDYINEKYFENEVTVAVIDGGIDTDHPLFENRLEGVSDAVEDVEGHGTAVAGVVADNSPVNVKILPVKCFENRNATDSDVAAAINYAVAMGADIINMSFGGEYSWLETAYTRAVDKAYSAGCTLIASAGNDSKDSRNYYPACSPKCITVSAIERTGKKANFSNYGSCVDVAAPGATINTAVIGGKSQTYSGTSFSAPFVSAAAACIKAVNPDATSKQIREIICGNVIPLNTNETGSVYGIISFLNYVENGNISEPVLFSKKSGYSSDPINLELYTRGGKEEIYYTLDGTVPTKETGIRYTDPLLVDDNCRIVARSYCEGKRESKITAAKYILNYHDSDSMFEITEDGIITKYTGTMKDLEIKDKINGITVRGISNAVFKGNKSIRSLVLPDTVVYLDDNSFAGCRLQSFVARGVTVLGNSVFLSNIDLKNIELGKLSYIGMNAFYSCDELDPSNLDFELVEEIPDGAFYDTAITYYPNPENVKSIGIRAFSRTPITTAHFPAAETVGTEAFDYCTRLESVSLPLVTVAEEQVFYLCYNMAKVDMPSLTVIKDRAFYNCAKITQIPNGKNITEIGNGAFHTCSRLEHFNVSDKLKSIGSNAFSQTIIKSINIPSSVEKIGYQAFGYCEELVSASIHSPILSSSMFINNTNLKFVYIAEGITEIPSLCFYNCRSLEKFIIPDGITKIGERVFYNCAKFEKIVIPESVEAIGFETFSNCTSLKEVIYISNKIESVENYTFNKCTSLKKVVLPASLKVIGQYAFYKTDIEKISIPDGVERIDRYAFANCVSLESVILPKGVKSIPQNAFEYCTNLKSINLENISNIYEYAFNGCKSLAELQISDELKEIKEYAFQNCVSLRKIAFPVCAIENEAFKGCTGLKSVSFSNGNNIINPFAFTNCGIETLYIPDTVANRYGIYDNAFTSCTKLKTVILKDHNGLGELFAKQTVKPMLYVTFDSSGGSECFDRCYSLGEYDMPLPTPYREGYTFKGWYYNGKKVSNDNPLKTENAKLVAQWEEKECVISVEGETYFSRAYGEKYGELPSHPEKEGYLPAGYAEGSVIVTSETVATRDAEIEMIYVPVIHSITLSTGEILKGYYGMNYGYLPTPVIEGYEFSGWYNEKGELVTSDTVITGDASLSARFKNFVCTVSFSDGVESMYVDYGTPIRNLPVPLKTGYVFLGWYDGDKLISNGSICSGNMMLTADWEKQSIEIRFENDRFPAITYYYGDSLVNLPVPKQSGCQFLGWRDQNGNGITDGYIVTQSLILSPLWLRTEPESLRFTKSEITMNVGETIGVEYTVSPSGKYNLIWTSDNENVASVNENGKITGRSQGTAIITVSSEAESCIAKITVNVRYSIWQRILDFIGRIFDVFQMLMSI